MNLQQDGAGHLAMQLVLDLLSTCQLDYSLSVLGAFVSSGDFIFSLLTVRRGPAPRAALCLVRRVCRLLLGWESSP